MSTRLTATTVRFDDDLWAALGEHARRLGVPRASFIRDATRAEIVRIETREQVARSTFGADLTAALARLDRIEAWIGRTR